MGGISKTPGASKSTENDREMGHLKSMQHLETVCGWDWVGNKEPQQLTPGCLGFRVLSKSILHGSNTIGLYIR